MMNDNTPLRFSAARGISREESRIHGERKKEREREREREKERDRNMYEKLELPA